MGNHSEADNHLETENLLETENRIRNLVWTVSGDYTLPVRPDVERFRREKYCVLYDCIRQGAFARWYCPEEFQLYLVKKIYCHGMEAPLKMIASLVTEAAVGKRLLEERRGVARIRQLAWEELLDQEFSMLCASAPGQLQLAWIRRQKDADYRAGGSVGKWLELLLTAEDAKDTGQLIRLTDQLYNRMMEPDFEKRNGTLEQVLAVTVEDLKEFSWQDFLSEEMYEDALETYLEKLSLDMMTLPEAKESAKEERQEEQPKKKKIVLVDENDRKKMHSYVELNYGKTWLTPAQEKQRNLKLCRGMHQGCSLYYTEGILKHPVRQNYQLAYAGKQKDKNLHAYYDAHRAVKQNIRQLTGALRKALALREDVQYFPADGGKACAFLDVEGRAVQSWESVSEGAEKRRHGSCGGCSDRCQRFPAGPPVSGGDAGIYPQRDFEQSWNPVPCHELLYVLGLHNPSPVPGL